MRLLIIGAGGHAKVVGDAARASGIEVVGYVDESGRLAGSVLLGLPVARAHGHLPRADAFVVAVGDNRARADRFGHYKAQGLLPMSVVHPHAVLAPDVEIGAGVVVFAGVVVNTGTRLCDNVVLNTASSVDHDCVVSAHAHIAPGCRLAGGVIVGEGAFLGIGTSVVPSRRMGDWSVCGAGSVVTEDVADGVIVAGVPARELAT